VPRSISCSLPATRNRCAGTPHIGSSRHVAKAYLSSDDDGTMNSAVDDTIYWGFLAFPLNNVPDPRYYVPCSQHDTAHKWLSYGIQTRKGMLLLTGDIGSRKTLLSHRLIVGLPPTQYDGAPVANPALCFFELLDEVLSQFRLDRVRSKVWRFWTLNERMHRIRSAGSARCWSWMKRK